MARLGESTRPKRRWLSWTAKALVASAILLAALYLLGEVYKSRDYLPWFLDRKSDLVTVDERLVEDNGTTSLVAVALEDENGIQVETYLRIPHAGGPRHPVIITLGGAGTGRKVIDYVGDTGDWIVLALDYPYRGETDDLSYWDFVSIVPEARRALLDTVPACMLAMDYLWRRNDVDRNRIVVAGGSFGALFSPAFAAADERVSAVAILFGAGNLQDVINANLDLPWPIRPVLSWIGSVIVSPLEPLKYVHHISPRPLFMLCGTEDEAMPAHCTRALVDRAGEPQTVSWLPLGHVNIRATELHEQILGEIVSWLHEIGFMSGDETFTIRETDTRSHR